MNERAKITASHLARQAIVYLRQSSTAQVEHNRESTDRQYALAAKARELGWPDDRITVIDEDLGLSGSGFVARSGFARLTAEVALSHVGLVLGLEVSRLARNNADWHRLIDLGGLTDTLIGDADGIYHPALFNDRLLLGLKGTMSEAELHVLRARLNGGIRNKAARGELRRGLPVGFVWGDADGEIRFHPDEAVVTAIHNVFARFAETGSARRVWLWFRSEGLTFPLQMHQGAEIRWVEASYTAIHTFLIDTKRLVCRDRRRHPVSSWSVNTTVLIRPLCSSPITGPSTLVQVGPPQTLALVLWPRGFGRFSFSLGIQGLDPAVPHESLHPIHAPSTPVAARPIIRSPTGLSQKIEPPLVLATSNQLSTRHRGFILIRLSDTHLPEFFFFGLFIQRSRPHLLNAAAWTGLGPAPESRSRGARPHLSCSLSTRLSVHFELSFRVLLQHTLNGWPVRSPADASPAPSRGTTHGLGPVWVAIPSP